MDATYSGGIYGLCADVLLRKYGGGNPDAVEGVGQGAFGFVLQPAHGW